MIHLALLRGINVGGKARLPMKDLAAIFAAAGATDIRTYIQTGNVLFNAPDPKSLAARVTAQVAAQFGYPTRIVLRSAEQLRQVWAGNPFAGVAEEAVHVYFLADRPRNAAIAALEPDRFPGDRFVVRDREIYLHLPGGMARTKLTNGYFDSRLDTFCTARNWKTVGALFRML